MQQITGSRHNQRRQRPSRTGLEIGARRKRLLSLGEVQKSKKYSMLLYGGPGWILNVACGVHGGSMEEDGGVKKEAKQCDGVCMKESVGN